MEPLAAAFVWLVSFSLAFGDVITCDAQCECQTISPNHITVHCARRSLLRIPVDIPSNVTYLDVSFNSISALDGGNIKNFNQLKKLDLRSNLVSRIDSWAFQKLVVLEELDLDNNLLQIITPYMFSAATNLKMLSLGNNLISAINRSAFIHLSLDSLNLRDNTKLTSVDNEAFVDSTIHTLILDGCGMSTISDVLFIPLADSLRVLSMSNMKNGLQIDSIALSTLDLDILQLVKNKMATDHLGFLNNTLKVKTLDLSMNKLGQLDLSLLRGLQNTESLVFKKSDIEQIVMTDKEQSNFNGIRELDLRGNTLKSFPSEVLQWMPNLRNLNIAHNPIHNMSVDISSLLQNLESIDISNVSLTCNCDLAWFVKWRNMTNTVVIGELCSAESKRTNPVSNCSAPHSLAAWVESNQGEGTDTSLDIFCRVHGNPSPLISLIRHQKSTMVTTNRSLLAVSSNGEVHFRSSSDDCFVYICTAVNYLGNETLSFHVCPSRDWTDATSSASSHAGNHSIKVWIMTIILSIVLFVLLLALCIVYVIKRRKSHGHMTRLQRNSSEHVTTGGNTSSNLTLTRYGQSDDDVWNSNEFT